MKRSREEVAKYVDDFVSGRGGSWDWDDFTSVPIEDPALEEVRQRCLRVAQDFPAESDRGWCGPAGMEELCRIVAELRDADGWKGDHSAHTPP